MIKKKLLITGAYGLVGSNICKILESDYPDIEITKVKFDIIPEIKDWGTYDYVIHAAGYGQPLKFTKDKLKTIEINTFYTDALFNFLKPGGSYLFVSSSEVYSGAPSPHKETDIGTTTPQHPRACYIEGKRCGEAICMAYRDMGFDFKIARLALAYGPGTKKGDTRVVNQFIEQALMTGTIKMRDSGDSIRTYLYIDDCVDMLLNILFDGKSVVYNVGGVSTVTIKELAETICNLTRSSLILGDQPLVGAPDLVQLDLGKIISEFEPSFTLLKEGLKKTIEYQKQLYGK